MDLSDLYMNKTIDSFLLRDGWRIGPNPLTKSICYFKRFDSNKQCNENRDRHGIQVQLSVFLFPNSKVESFEIGIVGALHDGTWIDIKNYCLPQDIKKVVQLVPRLIHIWESQ